LGDDIDLDDGATLDTYDMETSDTTVTWLNLVKFSGAISPISAYEQAQFDRETTQADHRLLIPGNAIPLEHQSAIKELNRITCDDKVYDISGVIPIGRGSGTSHWELNLIEYR